MTRCLMAIIALAGAVAGPESGWAAETCEAVVPARCFYIDANDGHDIMGDGSIASPWRTFANIMSYYQATWRPAGWVDIGPGDHIYLRGGVHGTTLTPGDDAGPGGGTRAIAYFRDGFGSTSGEPANPIHLRGYPGEHAVIGNIAGEPYGFGIYLLASQWWEISDLELRDIPGDCFRISTSGHMKIWNLEVHDCARKDTDGNPAGIKLVGAYNTEIFNSTFYDTFWDPRLVSPVPAGWFLRGAGIQLFQGYDHEIHHNVFTQTKQGKDIDGNDVGYADCMFQKHAQQTTTGQLHVHHNAFSRCGMAFGSGTQNTWFHHNVIRDSDVPVRSADFGGITYQVNQVYEYNTIINSRAFAMSPNLDTYNGLFPVLPEDVVYRNNIIYDSATSYTGERNMVDIGTYMSDDVYDAAVVALTFADNCYFNPSVAPRFNLGGANNGGTSGVKGGHYSLSEWQALTHEGRPLNYDQGSIVADPQFVDAGAHDYRLRETSPCAAMGAYAGTDPVRKPAAPTRLTVVP